MSQDPWSAQVVYVVSGHDHEQHWLLGVFTDIEKAKASAPRAGEWTIGMNDELAMVANAPLGEEWYRLVRVEVE